MLAGLEALLVQHLGHRGGVGADGLHLTVDGERHGLLGEEEGQRTADEPEEDDGEQAELEGAAHNTSTGVTEPGQENGCATPEGGRPSWSPPGQRPAGAPAPVGKRRPDRSPPRLSVTTR